MSKLSKFLNKALPGYKTHAAGAALIATPFVLPLVGYPVEPQDTMTFVLNGLAVMAGRAAISDVKSIARAAKDAALDAAVNAAKKSVK